MAKRRRPEPPQPPVVLHIDMDDDRVIEAVARFLLDIPRPRHERPAKPAQPGRRPAARKVRRKPPKP